MKNGEDRPVVGGGHTDSRCYVFSITYGGSCFALYLAGPREAAMTKRRILIVDDDAQIRTLVRTVLERAGYEVTAARNGHEAIELLAASDYDVILLDVMI